IYGTDFLYDDPESLEPAAREKALANAQDKASEIAQLIGVELGPVQQISEIVGHSGVYWDSDITPLWPGQLQFYLSLQVTYGAHDVTFGATPVAATATDSSTDTSTLTIHGGDEAALREFLRQYLISPFESTDANTTTVYVGTLPPDL